MNAGGGTELCGSCWFEVAVMAEVDAELPGVAGGVMTMTGIDAMPWPIVVAVPAL